MIISVKIPEISSRLKGGSFQEEMGKRNHNPLTSLLLEGMINQELHGIKNVINKNEGKGSGY